MTDTEAKRETGLPVAAWRWREEGVRGTWCFTGPEMSRWVDAIRREGFVYEPLYTRDALAGMNPDAIRELVEAAEAAANTEIYSEEHVNAVWRLRTALQGVRSTP